MSLFEGASILVSSTNYSNMGRIFFEQGELFDVVFQTPVPLMIGDPVTATVYHQSGSTTFQTIVFGTLEERVLLMKPQRDTPHGERRAFPRFPVELQATVVAEDQGKVQATIKDLSLGGLRIESDKYLEQGAEIEVLIDAATQLEGRGIVRRVQLKDGVFEFGVEFVKTEQLLRHLSTYLKRYVDSHKN